MALRMVLTVKIILGDLIQDLTMAFAPMGQQGSLVTHRDILKTY